MNSLENSLRIAICDDEPIERKLISRLLHKYLDEHNYMVAVDEYCSAEEFLKSDIKEYSLVFMDVLMPGTNGMEAARQIFRENERTKIVFCSSSDAFGVESYDVKAMHYLVKPVMEEKVFDVLDRFFSVYTSLKTIEVKVGRVEESIYVQDILWIESDRHNCIIHTKQNDIVTRSTFSKLLEQLPVGEFVKPIRYAMVAMQAVIAVPTDVMKLSDGTSIPIAKSAREAMKQAYADYRWKKMYE